jgi:hypothetical protein
LTWLNHYQDGGVRMIVDDDDEDVPALDNLMLLLLFLFPYLMSQDDDTNFEKM